MQIDSILGIDYLKRELREALEARVHLLHLRESNELTFHPESRVRGVSSGLGRAECDADFCKLLWPRVHMGTTQLILKCSSSIFNKIPKSTLPLPDDMRGYLGYAWEAS